MRRGKKRRKYDVAVDGLRIRNDADLDRVDMSKSERAWKHRKAKLEKRALEERPRLTGGFVENSERP